MFLFCFLGRGRRGEQCVNKSTSSSDMSNKSLMKLLWGCDLCMFVCMCVCVCIHVYIGLQIFCIDLYVLCVCVCVCVCVHVCLLH